MIIDAVNKGPEESLHLVEEHWKDLLLQYIGLLTAVIVGLLLAILLPIIGGISSVRNIQFIIFLLSGLFVCCCRCAGRCGVYPDTYYDKVGKILFYFSFSWTIFHIPEVRFLQKILYWSLVVFVGYHYHVWMCLCILDQPVQVQRNDRTASQAIKQSPRRGQIHQTYSGQYKTFTGG